MQQTAAHAKQKRETLMALAIHRPVLGKAAAAFLGNKHRMLINGKWVEARSGETFPVEDPATQEIIGLPPQEIIGLPPEYVSKIKGADKSGGSLSNGYVG
jgi:hypothetical protein